VSFFAIFQFTTGLGIPVPWDIERRVTGFFNYPNALGLFVAPVTSFAIVLATIKRGREQIFWAITAILGFIAILLAQTEAALVAIPTGLLLAFLFSDAARSRKLALTGVATAILVFALVLPITQSKLLLQDYSGEVRRAQWKESIQFVTDNPAFGAGLNGYATAISPYHDPTLYEIFQYPHNIILNIWTELGLLGIFVFFWLVVLTIKEMRRPNPSPIKLAAFAALATMTIHGLVDVPYFKNDLSAMTWIFIAILATRFDKETSTR